MSNTAGLPRFLVVKGGVWYSWGMDDGIEFNEAAFRHDISKEDIHWAVTHPLYEDLLEGFANKYLVLGYDNKRRLLEIMYNRIDNDTVNIFHAMKCTKKYLPLVGF